jgi:hypothetical protein
MTADKAAHSGSALMTTHPAPALWLRIGGSCFPMRAHGFVPDVPGAFYRAKF